MSYITPIPIGPGQFTSLADGSMPGGWQSLQAGSPAPLGTVGTISIIVGSPTITVNIVIGGVTTPMTLSNSSNNAYFLYLGTGNGVLVLGQGTAPGSSNFIEVYLYLPLTNTFATILTPQALDPGTFPGVLSSQQTMGPMFLLPLLSGSIFLFSYLTAPGSSPVQLYGFLYRSDDGRQIYQVGPLNLTNGSFFTVLTPPATTPPNIPTGIQIFQGGKLSGASLLTNSPVTIPSVLPQNDVYVRDWTATTTYDTGAQPDLPPSGQNLYTNGDVWNMNTQMPGNPVSGSYLNQDPIVGQPSYAYSRISRVAAGVLTQVSVEYLTAPFGTGNNFTSIGTETIAFPANSTTPVLGNGVGWTAPSTSSPHYCMAVEIQTDYDPLVSDLNQAQPGGADSQIADENNKAQRNMAVVIMGGPSLPPLKRRPVPLPLTHYAVIHNASVLPRDMVLRYDAAQEVLRQIPNMRIEVVGGDSIPFRQGGTLTLPGLQPGENRWIGLTLDAPPAAEGQMLTVHFSEMAGDAIVNGFAIAVQSAPLDRVIQANLAFHRSLCVRVAALFKEAQAKKEQPVPNALDPGAYEAFLQQHLGPMKEAMQHVLKEGQPGDSLGLAAALKSLETAIPEKDVGVMAVAHAALLYKLDASLTMVQLSRGNPADILQNVRWQDYLYTTLPLVKDLNCARLVRDASQQFIGSFRHRKTGERDFPGLIRELVPCFLETAGASPRRRGELEQLTAQMGTKMHDLAALQKAHRDVSAPNTGPLLIGQEPSPMCGRPSPPATRTRAGNFR